NKASLSHISVTDVNEPHNKRELSNTDIIRDIARTKGQKCALQIHILIEVPQALNCPFSSIENVFLRTFVNVLHVLLMTVMEYVYDYIILLFVLWLNVFGFQDIFQRLGVDLQWGKITKTLAKTHTIENPIHKK
ncbi:hypothetical protein ACJX0J_021013, partial [Zea mays]